ncbi:MAG: LysR family transcriptional regulator [Nevskiaceae bacterium]|nr:MAG: LysR family transcriptional regulator [Nevskiaceae bacterium]TBR74701.1 MAG: LysR family transcriptional regulator [Nevskiaceae bacterium]
MELARHLDAFYLFVQVVDAGGFSCAARHMGTTRSKLSRRIIALEEALGTQLLYRDSHRFALTPTGEIVYRHAILMCAAAQATLDAALAAQDTRHDELSLDMCDALNPLMSRIMVVFGQHRPQMRLTTHARHDIESLLCHQTDVVIHLGGELPDNRNIVAHPLGHARVVIVASPELFRQLKQPQHPDEIKTEHRLGYTGHGLMPEWQLRGTTEKPRYFRMVSDHLATVIQAARDGIGLVQLPLFTCRDDIADGRLVLAFQKFEPTALPLHALTLADSECRQATLEYVDFARECLAAMARSAIWRSSITVCGSGSRPRETGRAMNTTLLNARQFVAPKTAGMLSAVSRHTAAVPVQAGSVPAPTPPFS